MSEPLVGMEAEDALFELLFPAYDETESLFRAVQEALKSGRIIVLPETDPPCVARLVHIFSGREDMVEKWRNKGLSMHEFGYCSCKADALLRCWVDSYKGGQLETTTRTYLEAR